MVELFDGVAARRILPILTSLVDEEPVIALHGPRSVGKSTILRTFAEARGVDVIDLDDPEVLDAVRANPTTAVSGASPVCIDEYQRALPVLDALKARLNRDNTQPGTAVLTGSTRHDAIPRTAQALTGRLHVLTLLPLSQGEIIGNVEDLLPALLTSPVETVAAHPASTTTREQYAALVCAGGFPLALRRTGASRSRWFRDYVRLSLERDAAELAQVRDRESLRQILNVLAGQTAQVLNIAEAARRVDIKRDTAAGYTRLLEDLFLVQQTPAWGKTLNSTAAKHPKIHVVDSGLGAWLLGSNPQRLATLDPTALTEFGHLLESFAVGELRKQISWLDEPVGLGHWRDHSDGSEVDAVVEFDDGRVLGFEVKANQRVAGKDLAGLAKLRDRLGDRFIAGVALSTGSRSYSTDQDRVHVMPLDRLWTPVLL